MKKLIHKLLTFLIKLNNYKPNTSILGNPTKPSDSVSMDYVNKQLQTCTTLNKEVEKTVL